MGYATALFIFVAAVWLYGANLLQRWRMRKFPGPRSAWLWGNLKALKHDIQPIAYAKWKRQHGSVFRVFLGRHPVIVVSDLDVAREVGLRQFAAFHDRPTISGQSTTGKQGAVGRAGMLQAKGTDWATVRAAAQPMFHSKSLNSYVADMEAAVEKMVAEVDVRAAAGGPFDIKATLECMTMQVIGSTAFGVDFGAQHAPGKPDSPLLAAARALFLGSVSRAWIVVALVAPPLVALQPLAAALRLSGKARWEQGRPGRTVLNTSADLLDNARAQQAAAAGQPRPARCDTWRWWRGDDTSPYKETVPKENSLIAMMLRTRTKGEGLPLTDVQIMAQTSVFIAAGYETTSVALTFAIRLLALHPEAERKLLAEVDRLPRDRALTRDDLDALEYTAAVASEAMRLYPPAVMSRRVAPHATQAGKWTIPANTAVNIDIWSIHRDPQHWPQPEEFRPERFLDPKEVEARHPNAYMPFGIGPRMCIGYKFALQELHLALARLYKRYTFRLAAPDEPLRLRYGITISPIGGLPVIARPCN